MNSELKENLNTKYDYSFSSSIVRKGQSYIKLKHSLPCNYTCKMSIAEQSHIGLEGVRGALIEL